jgi:prepilin-type processing-associated H-X9-DG protein
MRKTSTRAGFSLFQLLLVLAILLVLLAMLLPAVVRVRQAAARTQSANNLKQIGLACHNYLSVYNVFPPGNDDNNFSASAYLLPYVEQQNVFRLIDFKKPVDDKANTAARAVTIKVFLSPDDPMVNVTPNEGATNYPFIAGSKPALADNDGIFFQNSKVRITDITDGTSNTTMAVATLKGDGQTKPMDVKRQYVRLKKDALKGIKPDAGVQDWKDGKNISGDRCASWMDGRFLQSTFSATLSFNDEKPDVSCAGLGGLSAPRTLDMPGTPVLFADGHVSFMSNKVPLAVWQALATRAGGEKIPAGIIDY